MTYATTHPSQLEIPEYWHGSIEVHIQVPAGAISKDGPSAGVTMSTALVSAMSGRPVRTDVAVTGEITLRGRVLPIGGLREKVLGAHRAGITDIVLPKDNEADIEDIPEDVQKCLSFHPVSTLDEVFEVALLPSLQPVNTPKQIMEEEKERGRAAGEGEAGGGVSATSLGGARAPGFGREPFRLTLVSRAVSARQRSCKRVHRCYRCGRVFIGSSKDRLGLRLGAVR